MAGFRRIDRVLKGEPTIEGAGVKLKRAFGPREVPMFDPFLLLDDFHSDDPDDYLAGFPWHPHRGIETVTYVLDGMVEHGDSMGNRGVIRSGDVQWMTAGNGIIHQEMPKGSEGGLLWGFQLWVNLPASHKMDDPTYRGVTRGEIPEVEVDTGVRVKVICGELRGIKGPVQGLTVDCEYLDVMLEPNAQLEHSAKRGHKEFVYVVRGRGYFDEQMSEPIDAEHVVVFSGGEKVKVGTSDNSLRCLMISGKPIGEPVAWLGPIVMNTQEELRTAFGELDRGTFLRNLKATKKPPELHPTYYKR